MLLRREHGHARLVESNFSMLVLISAPSNEFRSHLRRFTIKGSMMTEQVASIASAADIAFATKEWLLIYYAANQSISQYLPFRLGVYGKSIKRYQPL
jgi:hypothetical protein